MPTIILSIVAGILFSLLPKGGPNWGMSAVFAILFVIEGHGFLLLGTFAWSFLALREMEGV